MNKELIQDLLSGDYTEIKDVEVLNNYENTYGLNFSEQDLEDYAKNTNEIIAKGLLKPNIKISHSDQQVILRELYNMADVDIWEELPNMGLLTNFRRVGKKVIADIGQIPKKLKEVIFGGRLFTSLSPELVRNWRETGKNIIRAVALSNIPSMKHIVDVPMSQGFGYRGSLVIEDDGGKIMDPKEMTEKVESIIDTKLEKNNEGLLTKFSDMVGKLIKGKGKEDPIVIKPNKENMISLSEVQEMMDEQAKQFGTQLNELKIQLVSKEKSITNLSDNFKKNTLKTKKAEADALCKEASLNGIPPVIIELFRPVLMSEQSDQVIKFSEEVTKEDGGKTMVEIEKPFGTFIQDLFKIYPNKVNMSEISKTYLSAPSEDEEKLISARTKDLIAQGKTMHEALTIAGAEIRK